MENNELLTNEIENEVTLTEIETYEEIETESGSGRKIGVLFAVGAALTGVGVAAWKNKDKIKQYRINRLEKKLSKLYGEVESDAIEAEELIEEEVVAVENENK